MGKLLSGIVAAIFLFPQVSAAKPVPLPIKDRIHNLETILSHSAKDKIDPTELERIRQMLEKAESALKAEDSAAAEKLYSEAWKSSKTALKSAHAQNHYANDQKNLDARKMSIRALLKQFEGTEKEADGKKIEQAKSVKSLLAQAETSTDPIMSRELVNQAYYMMKILMRDARQGKTLTFDHTFETPALKYADEAAYNDLHFGLLDIALVKFRAQPDAKYTDLVKGAKKLRELAEEAAERNDYESAINTLTLSTREIKKALTHLGLSIPGS